MTIHLFETSVYTLRREQLKKALGPVGLVLLLGNEDSSMNYKDNCYPFRQDSSFLYYFGLGVAGLAAVIDTDTGEEFIIGDELTLDDIIWTGTLPTVKEMAAKVGIYRTKTKAEAVTALQKALASGREVSILPPYRPENTLKIAAWLNITIANVKNYISPALVEAVIAQRAIKTPLEIAEIENAVSISVDMQLAVIRHTRPGVKGYELVAKAQEAAIAQNAQLGYPAIITDAGQTLHTHHYDYTLEDGRMLLCDTGAENKMRYGGDLTRTVPVGRQFTRKQREVYNIVLKAMDSAVAMLKPGVRYKDIHINACEKLAEGLVQIGLMRGNPAEIVAAGAHAMFFQCGLGHMLGMDTHDMEDLGENLVGYSDTVKRDPTFGIKSLRLARELEAGYVLTVEPGVYIIPELIDRWQAEQQHTNFINYDVLNTYRDFGGIRIEDNYLITEAGSKTLGKPLPKTAEEMEALKE